MSQALTVAPPIQPVEIIGPDGSYLSLLPVTPGEIHDLVYDFSRPVEFRLARLEGLRDAVRDGLYPDDGQDQRLLLTLLRQAVSLVRFEYGVNRPFEPDACDA